MGRSSGFWDIEARAFEETDIFLGPCLTVCAWDADAWLEEQWNLDVFAVSEVEDMIPGWVAKRDERVRIRTILLWMLQLEYAGRHLGPN